MLLKRHVGGVFPETLPRESFHSLSTSVKCPIQIVSSAQEKEKKDEQKISNRKTQGSCLYPQGVAQDIPNKLYQAHHFSSFLKETKQRSLNYHKYFPCIHLYNPIHLTPSSIREMDSGLQKDDAIIHLLVFKMAQDTAVLFAEQTLDPAVRISHLSRYIFINKMKLASDHTTLGNLRHCKCKSKVFCKLFKSPE